MNFDKGKRIWKKRTKVPDEDMRNALRYALSLFEDSKLLFQAMADKKEMEQKSPSS